MCFVFLYHLKVTKRAFPEINYTEAQKDEPVQESCFFGNDIFSLFSAIWLSDQYDVWRINQETLGTSAHWSFSKSHPRYFFALKSDVNYVRMNWLDILSTVTIVLRITEWYRPFDYALFVELFTVFQWVNSNPTWRWKILVGPLAFRYQ